MSNINQSTPNQQVNSKNAVKIISVLLGLLIIVNIFIFSSGTVVSGKTMETTVSEKDKTLQTLQQQFDATKRALDSLQLVFPAQQQELEMMKVELQEKRMKLETEIRNGKDLAQAREEIKQLREQRDNFAAKIAKLEERIVAQQQQVTEYQNQNQQLTTQLAEVSQQNENEKAKNREAEEAQAKEQARIVKQKREEEERKLREARLTISDLNINMMQVSKKDNTKEKPTKKAKSVNRFKISFSHGTNNAIKEGNVQFQIKITDSQGLTIGANNIGLDKSTETPFKYTFAVETAYTGSENQVNAIWNVPADLELNRGIYTIEIFQNGWKVGNGTITVK